MVEWRRPGEPVKTAQYELYDYQDDPQETENHADKQPEVMARLKAILSKYPEAFSRSRKKNSVAASRTNTQSPMIANKPIRVMAEVSARNGHGVVLCQGGQEQGYAVHFIQGRPAFDIRVNGRVTRILAPDPIQGSIKLEASLDKKTMRLSANGKLLVESPSPGLIPVQPKDPMSIGQDELSAAGDYKAPNPFNGKVISTKVLSSK